MLLEKLCNDTQRKSELRKATIKLFELRNRLVHPKEKPESTDLTLSNPKESKATIETARELESEIETLMYSVDLEERKQQILEIGGWFESSIFEYYKRNLA